MTEDEPDEDAGGRSGGGSETVPLVVVDGDDRVELAVERGRNLRRVMLDAGLSPYASATRRLNCGGRGICATCGVRVREGPPADQWHDRLADRFGYPRLSCQIAVDRPMTVALVDKRVWGGRRSSGDG
ncbi:2Fe-2S iron-sulfur cluster-binding protein [Halorubrum ezzemoulense]|jgi:ferredoxin|uniref:(2Fe-2S)-binding protein n=1 Tax=Halorubrum ezzemoulense TaxID=337243 RepID=A0A256J8S0_HALEZ|nr:MULTISPECIES: 2Fe-2S iron-sulfur cluster-binding protein [Halorubrum]MDB2237383.1 2Fe-2S iron-sulfur cluster-binding protein [Halorubrum ezzemoulense]MDB2246667.1 2Fe-2S iron-sulfur cluster-binding protein [Halorubrum ezzemoulense]MDB9250509.1 2Fe-2S iron-sulfur cluster-binding protein [Halorubrum ezzemoulense]MDB9260633.1 2Fe-2S iron-sulfur cluster-binding protein [Halorubrum ezzemoulense]MDB9264013.1 2Fe-2S iron-sulfur cluster-binding protein [Halorubrum ezzemoulense]